ncbi:Oidioi.mRNA.OKI2018_I69.PAR.g12239.t1.cds [Oikopleura dioica]|uniref:Oidioi.mRNA.OKI2018_I69.PAR.g12239.t1.cds n=1 Tax=Oikopleura dioica TaxID=34765 RepID=A0ABN7RZ60_OIKDI|nr:Oidioi.mRNA.OKI2018_I69.PAR.g12239.t1.cds [Oikopleura dioica]
MLKGDVVFLAQCQCFRAESEIIKKHSNKLTRLVEEHIGEEFIPLECSAVILDHLLNSFYSISRLKLETIECLMLLHAAQRYECRKTRDWCVEQIKKTLVSSDAMALLVALDIVARYCQNPPPQLDNLVASCVNYLINNNAFGRIEGVKQFHPKIFAMDESVLTQLAVGVAENGSGKGSIHEELERLARTFIEPFEKETRSSNFEKFLIFGRESNAKAPELNSTQISKIIQFQHFHENFEPLQFLSLAIAKVILTKHN